MFKHLNSENKKKNFKIKHISSKNLNKHPKILKFQTEFIQYFNRQYFKKYKTQYSQNTNRIFVRKFWQKFLEIAENQIFNYLVKSFKII